MKSLPKTWADSAWMANKFVYIAPPETVEICRYYAAGKAQYNDHYVEERAAEPTKLFFQDAYSKLSEFAVKDHLALWGIHHEVDTKVYPPGQKNWNSDLGDFAIKSCALDMRDYYLRGTGGRSSRSWTFQYANKSGRGGKDMKIFGPEEGRSRFCIFTVVGANKDIRPGTPVWICSMCRVSDLHSSRILFGATISESLRSYKFAVYEQGLKFLQRHLLSAGDTTPIDLLQHSHAEQLLG